MASMSLAAAVIAGLGLIKMIRDFPAVGYPSSLITVIMGGLQGSIGIYMHLSIFISIQK